MSIEFDVTGKITKVNVPPGVWSEKRSAGFHYYSQSAPTLLHATETLKSIPSIPPQTYYVVETPDGNLGRDIWSFYTEARLKTTGLRLATSRSIPGEVEAVSLKFFGDMMKSSRSVVEQRDLGQYATLVMLLECGHCGYESPVETQAGTFERECYGCGAMNHCQRDKVVILIGSRTVEI